MAEKKKRKNRAFEPTVLEWSRFLVLDRCLRDKHGRYKMEDLVREVNKMLERYDFTPISSRTISKDNVSEHFQKAVEHYATRPNPDVRNSIKESISAVEAVCRELTGENTLGQALKRLEDNGVVIYKMLKDQFTKFYVYSNDPNSGIRHALMDDDGTYVPTKDEAYYMLVSCSAFVNYLRRKVAP